eukprot:Phypoly_transcript_00656.p1 GENE.Phypoly_transcript_00656~~Phypoly_transcript_00656.p1  ORF type:complete len:780 (-),score=55.25 Phypoly_transcript_00656:186-2525(-)
MSSYFDKRSSFALYDVPYTRVSTKYEEPPRHNSHMASGAEKEKMKHFEAFLRAISAKCVNLLARVTKYVTRIADNSKALESLDFHVPDNRIYRDWVAATPKKTWMEKTLGKWVVCLLIGFVVGLLAYGIRWTVELLNDYKYEISDKFLHKSHGIFGFLIYYAMNIAFATGSYLFVLFFGPGVSSSGIPEVTGYLNGVRVPKTFNIRTFFAKVASLIFGYASSLALGPEGPMIHLGALVGAAVGPLKSKSLGLYSKLGWKYGNDKDKRDFISSGAAAGISAAFGAPIGGTLFALEEATSFWSRQLGWRTFFCCMASSFTVNGILQIKARSQQVQDYGLLTFGFSNTYLYRYAELAPFCLLAILGGLIGAFFVKLNGDLNMWRAKFFKDRHFIYRYIEVLVVVTIASALCFGIPAAYPCRGRENLVKYNTTTAACDKQLDIAHLQTMFCDDKTEYNDMASLLWTPPNVALPLLYHRDIGTFSLLTLGIYPVIYFFLAVLSSGLNVAGGLFIPMMLVGGAIGRFVGHIVLIMFPHTTPSIDPSIYALMGSAAVMTGFCRMTISLVVILVELTEGTQYLLPIILVVMLAKWVGDYFSHSIYERLIHIKGLPFLENNPPKECAILGVTEVMQHNVVTFREIEKVDTILRVLCETMHYGFPVVAENNVFKGMILRNQLLVLLERQIFLDNAAAADMQMTEPVSYPEFADLLTRQLPKPEAMHFTDKELDMYIDLRSYVNHSSITVDSTFSFVNAYSLFRTMGLRHLPVLDDGHRVIGIVTRKDLL